MLSLTFVLPSLQTQQLEVLPKHAQVIRLICWNCCAVDGVCSDVC